MLMNTSERFGSITKFVHWSLVLLLVAQFIVIWTRNSLPVDAPARATYMFWHRSLGVSILLLGLFFIIWRITNKKPLPLSSSPRWQRIALKIVQHSLLTLVVLMSVVGYCISSAAGKETTFFGLFTFPNLIPQNKILVPVFALIHEKMGILILVVVGVHALAALFHHFVLKDNVLRRMLP